MLTAALASEAEGAWAKHGAYAVAWKYLLYVLVMGAVVGDATRIQKGAVERIQRYLRDHHRAKQGSKLSLLVAYLKRMEGVKIGPVAASIKTRELERMYKLDEIAPFIEDLKEAPRTRSVVVLVDELDRGGHQKLLFVGTPNGGLRLRRGLTTHERPGTPTAQRRAGPHAHRTHQLRPTPALHPTRASRLPTTGVERR